MTQNVPETVSVDAPAEDLRGVVSVLMNMAPMITQMSGHSIEPEALMKIRAFLGEALVPGAIAEISIALPNGAAARFNVRLT
jgi:hypothetical protein